jgi:hypothetical protein
MSGGAIRRLAICVTFHYVEQRLVYLRQIASHFASLADEVDVTIVTNTTDADETQRALETLPPQLAQRAIHASPGLGHPYLLPWSHFVVMRRKIEDPSFTHFLYVEDDLCVTQATVQYWLGARETLRRFGLIPSILRVERKPGETAWYSTDQMERVAIERSSRLSGPHERIGYLNLPNPYQGLYLLDRELMLEHLNGPSCSPDFGRWHIREKAAQGLTFANIPYGFTSRNVVPFEVATKSVPDYCFVHHLPNNYAMDATSKFGKVPVAALLY